MTPEQTLELRQGEIRRRMAELASAETTDETRASIESLATEYKDNDLKIAALTVSDDAPVELVPSTTSGTSCTIRPAWASWCIT